MSDIDALATVVFDDARRLRERTGAIKQLGMSGDQAALEPLLRALTGGHGTLATGAATALGKMGAREAVPALIQVLGTHPDKGARMMSADALGKIGDPAAADALRQASSDRVEAVRTTSRSALKNLERAATAAVRTNPEQADEQAQSLAAGQRDRRAFNLPFIFLGLLAAGAIIYWSSGSDGLTTALPVLIGAAVLVVAVNLAQGWWKNRSK